MESCGSSVPVAVVGVACRLPGGITQLDGLWRALADGRDLISPGPPDGRFDAARFSDPDPERPGRAYTMAGGYLEDVAGFDPEYFGISPREARHMDPQQRMLLEMTAEALDDAAIAPAALAGSDTAVYVGVSDLSYGGLQMSKVEEICGHSMSGSALSITANRLSYAFDLRGPSLAVDTACSSSLTAVHQACEALRTGRSPVAVAGGANLLLSPAHFIGFSKAMMLSPRGRVAAFSAGADGYVRAEGGGVVVLKRLSDALADGDRVHAVIAASASNSDGRTSAMTVPSTEMQRRLLREAYERAGAAPDQVLYFEAHGTGTPVGDPLECRAVGEALGVRRTTGPLPIGSVKTNLGHMEPASGMAGLFKGLLVLRHRTVPPSLHGDPPNPAIDFTGLNLSPVHDACPLAGREDGVVGVNSFGFGGANAHVVLSPPPARARTELPPEHGPLPLVVSARTHDALAQAARAVAGRVREATPGDFYDLCWTASRRRGRHPHRVAVLASGPDEAAGRLEALAADGAGLAAAEVRVPEPGGTVFVYCGNGTQWPGMGAALMAGEPAFRAAVEAADAELEPLLGWSVARLLAGTHGTADGTADTATDAMTEAMTDTARAQPALFAYQLGLTALLAEHGVRPAAVLGHSVGEVAAAHACGALGTAEAARVVAARSRTQAATAGTGRMAAIGLGEPDAREALAAHGGRLEIAAVNSARDVTVSGDPAALDALGRELAARGVPFRALAVDHGFHSAAMDVIEEPLRAALAGLTSHAPRLPMYSTVTGDPVGAGELDAAYWWHNARRPVRFADAVRRAAGAGLGAVVEIAPQPALAGALCRIAADAPRGAFPVVSPVSRERCAGADVRRAAARLLAAAEPAALDARFPRPGAVADLPPYPWQRQRHWHGTPEHWIRTSGDGVLVHPLLGERVPVLEPTWHTAVERTRTPWLADHRIAGAVVMPAAGFVELALAAAREVHSAGTPAEIDDLDIVRALPLPWDAVTDVGLQTSLCDEDGILRVASRIGEPGGWRPHARARVRRLAAARPDGMDTDAVRARLGRALDTGELYAGLAEAGLEYGPAFRVLRDLRASAGEVLAGYRCDPPDDGYGGYVVHPALLDGALQAGAPLLEVAEDGYLPARIDRVRFWAPPAPDGLVHVRQRSRTAREAVWDVTVAGPDGTVALELTGCRLRRVGLRAGGRAEEYASVLRAAPLAGQPVPPWTPPAPSEVAAAAAEGVRRVWESAPVVGQFATGAPMFRRMTAECAVRAFARLLPGRGTFTFDDLTAAGVLPRHGKLVRLLARLARDEGLLADEGAGWRRLPAADAPERPRGWEFLSTLASWVATGCLGQRFALHLPDLLCGRRDPLDLLFQDSGPELAQLYYDLDPPTALHNRLAAELLAAVVRSWPPDRPLRVLEIGAGTGGLTAHLLPLLDDRARYVFTDVSAAFFPAAQARFDAPAAHLSYRTLDLDRDAADQGFDDGSFDVVVAGFALHTAADLRRSLGRLARLTAPGGYLLALETHEPELLALLFGAMESFWSAQDRELRPDSVLLPHDRWPGVLADGGFEDVVQTDVPGMREQFSVLLARTPAGPPPECPGPAPSEDRSWLLVAEHEEEHALAGLLAARLAAAGGSLPEVRPWPAGPGEWEKALADDPDATVVLMLGAACDRAAGEDPAAAVELAVRRAAALRSLARAEQGRTGDRARRLVLVTHPSGALPAPERPAFPGQAAAWAVTRTLSREQDVTGRRISLDRGPDPALDAARLARELLADAPAEEGEQVHDEVALTGGGRFVHLVERARPATVLARPDDGTAYRLDLRDQGLAHRLRWTETEPPVPGPGEVVVAVRAAALNYRDVMVATGLLPPGAEDGLPSEAFLGLEGAGVVTAVGEGVGRFDVGDRVFGFLPGAFASHVRVPATAVRRIPGGLSFADAATVPVAYFTVHHALAHLARLRSGETLLVHGVAGGVGMAAGRFALRAGARVIGTAGTPAKRDMATVFGAELVLDSRTPAFADAVLAHTGGRGVDVVLNSLSGDAGARTREVLAPRGRFVELGKRDVFTNQRMLQRPLAENASLFFVDAANLVWQDPRHAGTVFDEVAERLRTRTYLPLFHQIYPAHRIDEAFRLMQHSKHLGKIVIGFDGPVPVHRAPRRLHLDGDGTYLVTGGLGGFGAETARRLAERGARHLALVSRRGPEAPDAARLVGELGALGARARAHAADVSDPAAVRALVEEVTAAGRPVRGIVHAAMHLDDGALAELDDDRFRSVLAPKWGGALALDALCPDAEFIAYSSVSPLVGNPLQSNYAAANLAMEALVRARRAAGRPGLAVAWGAIGRVGYVARNNLTASTTAVGCPPMDPREALTALEDLCERRAERTTFGRIDWQRLSVLLAPGAVPRFAAVLPDRIEGSDWQLDEFLERLATATPAEAAGLLEDLVAGMAASVLHMAPGELDRHRPLQQYGMDSLMGLEMLSTFRSRLQQDVPVMELLHSDGSVHGIAGTVLPHLLRQARARVQDGGR
ncbi:type I polyketide synthase [Streptomyces caatingaensis]|uniref:Uncharacterized protein n=1 Tax=Streptomyces caatingaensis TaxID=1678637 RepID=A0A0K9XAK5_9ACTN|nr:type I polyketide synthase [Streptomyces caatingaensis]KNB50454.1 hypothetical protein AC230_20975 [Streptomyces caatingaensis]